MTEKIGKTARRLATVGLPLALFLALVVGLTVFAQNPAPGDASGLALYELDLQGAESSSVSVEVPPGFEYVGLAAGSQVGVEPDVSADGTKLVWTGPFSEANVLRFWLAPVDSVAAPSDLPVAGSATGAVRVEPVIHAPPEGEAATPDSALIGTVEVTKIVDPEVLYPADSRWVVYEVVFTHDQGGPVTLDTVTDTLPEGFVMGGMAYGSEVTDPPTYAGGTQYVWESVTFTNSLTMRYYVRAVDELGEYQNSVEALAGSQAIGPASSNLTVTKHYAFLPMLIKSPPATTPLPYEENFDTDPAQHWQPFLNWPGLDAERWWVQGGVYNYYSNRVLPEHKGFDLSMFLGPGAQTWTDYRIEARIKDVKDHNLKSGLTGIWFRGTYEDSGAMDGRRVGGYYFFMRPNNDALYLDRINLDDSQFNSMSLIGTHYYKPGIGRKNWYDVVIEVRGFNVKIWFGDDNDGMTQVFNWTDAKQLWPQGTVGFATYFTMSRFDYIRVLPLD